MNFAYLLSSASFDEWWKQTQKVNEMFEKTCQTISDDFYNYSASNIKELFEYAIDNPLCVTLVCVTLVLLAFHIFCPFITRVFRR